MSTVTAAVALGAALFFAASGALSAAGSTPATAAVTRVKPITITSTCTGTIFCFSPMDRSVASGVQVVWTNTTFAPHILALCTTLACGVTSGTGTDTGFGSGTINSGQTYAFTFHGLGTYTYYCAIHGYLTMHGTITVDPLPTITTASPASAARGASNVVVSVTGTGFRTGIKAKYSGTGVAVASTVRVSATHLNVTISVSPGAATGHRRLTLTNTDGGVVAKANALNVT